MPARFDAAAVISAAARLSNVPKVVETATKRALSTLVRDLPPEASRDIRDEFNLPAKRVNDALSARLVGDAVELSGSGRAIGLAAYGARETSAGVVVTIRKDQGAVVFRHAFMATPGGRASSTGRQVFERQLVGGKRAPRYPLDRGFSQNVAGMLRARARADRLGNFGLSKLATEIQRNIGVLSGYP